MYSTKALRQAAHAAERTPLIRFIGKRTVPCMSFLPSRSVTKLAVTVARRRGLDNWKANKSCLRRSQHRPHPPSSPAVPDRVAAR